MTHRESISLPSVQFIYMNTPEHYSHAGNVPHVFVLFPSSNQYIEMPLDAARQMHRNLTEFLARVDR